MRHNELTPFFLFPSDRLRLNGLACQENGVRNEIELFCRRRFAKRFEASDAAYEQVYYLAVVIAWLLWICTQSPAADSWNALPGFESREQCAVKMKDKLVVWRQFKDAVIGENTVTFTENNTTMTYICLSDDEDPRRKPKSLLPKQPVS